MNNFDFVGLIELLLAAPYGQIDPSMLALIEQWDRPIPKSIQVLEVIDKSIYSALCSDFVIGVMNVIYDQALIAENLTHDDVVKHASWRTADGL